MLLDVNLLHVQYLQGFKTKENETEKCDSELRSRFTNFTAEKGLPYLQ
jgi:hypothetical protein